MNKYFKISAFALVLAGFIACESDDKTVDEVVAATERGAVLRTAELISNEIPIGNPDGDAQFGVTLEEQDVEGGDLLDNVEVFIGFRDNTVGTGETDLDVAQALYTTIPASEFVDGPFGLPRTTFTASYDELLSFTGLSENDLDGGDQFTVRFILNLTDGRSFSDANNSGTLTGSFFSSPFLYTPTVFCPVPEDAFTGEYVINQVRQGIFASNTWGDGTVVTLGPPSTEGAPSTQRSFSAVYLPAFGIGNGPREFIFDFICGEVIVPGGQPSGLQCSGGILFGPPPADDRGTYAFPSIDDSTFNIVFTDDETADCGGSVVAEVQLTKQ